MGVRERAAWLAYVDRLGLPDAVVTLMRTEVLAADQALARVLGALELTYRRAVAAAAAAGPRQGGKRGA